MLKTQRAHIMSNQDGLIESKADTLFFHKLLEFREAMESERGKLPILDDWLNYLTAYEEALEDMERGE